MFNNNSTIEETKQAPPQDIEKDQLEENEQEAQNSESLTK